jgi:endogenous inhibitor of DNA gyrase (YacG/DUF329 family)
MAEYECDYCNKPFTHKPFGSFEAFCSQRCYDLAYYEPPDPQDAIDQAEYEAGLAEGQRYSDECKMYGEELANEFALSDEHNAFWKEGRE